MSPIYAFVQYLSVGKRLPICHNESCLKPTQNDGNHIHSVWRDFNGDFGRDLLREHLKSVAH